MMATVRILHASDLHISVYKNERSPVDKFSDLHMQGNLNLWTLSKLGREAYKSFRQKMTASSYSPQLLKYLAHFIYYQARRKVTEDGLLIEQEGPEKIDAVILTGDLATTGNLNDIQKVKRFLTADFNPKYPYISRRQEATLSALKIPVWYFPGNHDRFVPTREWVWINKLPFPKFFDPGGLEFDKELSNFSLEPAQVLGEILPYGATTSSLRIIVLAADFNLRRFGDHEGFYGWLAQGKVYDDILKSLIQKTEEEVSRHSVSSRAGLCPLWAVHFPPAFPHINKASRLIWEEKLLEGAKRCGVKAILAGHTHEQVQYRKPSMDCDVLCCGTTTQYEPVVLKYNQPPVSGGNRFQIIVVTVDSSNNIQISIENYRYKRVGEDHVSKPYFYKEQ
jgi:3',5'-cyclic AMP phosphodiesterase CpdA